MNNQGSARSCCMCSEVCCHTGPHTYCEKHSNNGVISNPPFKLPDPFVHYTVTTILPEKSKEDQIIGLLTQLLEETKKNNEHLRSLRQIATNRTYF